MTEPPRLVASSSHPRTRALLEAGLADNPRKGAAKRTAAALGLSAGALATIGSSAASAAPSVAALGGASASIALPSAATAGVVATGSSASVVALVGQWLAIGVLAGLGLAGGATYLGSTATPTRTAVNGSAVPATPPTRAVHSGPPAASAQRSELASDVASTTSTPTGTIATSAPIGAAVASAASSAPARISAREPAAAAAGSAPHAADSAPSAPATLDLAPANGRLGREVLLIDEARRALASGHADRALATLDTYGSLVRTGTLDREAQILRIEAFTALGQTGAARALALAYLRAYPGDPRASSLSALIAAPEPVP